MFVVLALAILISFFFLVGALITNPGILLLVLLGSFVWMIFHKISVDEENRRRMEFEAQKMRNEKFYGLSMQNRVVRLHKDNQGTDVYIPGVNLRYYKG